MTVNADWLCVRFLYFHFFARVSTQRSALSTATQHVMQNLAVSEKQSVLSLNTRFPLPTLLCAGYSVKLNICGAELDGKSQKIIKLNYLLGK